MNSKNINKAKYKNMKNICMCVCFVCVMDIRQCKLNNYMRFFFLE